MLVLTRRIGETMVVGDDVNITVLGVKGNQVRLGINAPKDIPVHRQEIYLKIQEENGVVNDSMLIKRVAGSELHHSICSKEIFPTDSHINAGVFLWGSNSETRSSVPERS